MTTRDPFGFFDARDLLFYVTGLAVGFALAILELAIARAMA